MEEVEGVASGSKGRPVLIGDDANVAEEEAVQELTDHLSLGRADTASTITLLNMLRALSAHTPFKTLVCKDLPTLMEVVWQKMDNPWVSQRRGKPLDHS